MPFVDVIMNGQDIATYYLEALLTNARKTVLLYLVKASLQQSQCGCRASSEERRPVAYLPAKLLFGSGAQNRHNSASDCGVQIDV